jgi:glycosyltransferase involved in cell wall biosynthesis
MKDMPLVTGVIATYNRGHIVGEAIESILQQTYENIEVIVVDDGSTDDTQEKLKQYGDRIRVLYQNNSGPAAAWNRGIEASQGEIIAFLGSDDIWLQTFIQRQVSVLQQAGESVPCCLANAWLMFASGRQRTSFDNALLYTPYEEGIWLNVADVLATRFVVFGQTVAIRRRALERTGGFDERLRYLEDYDMALRLSLQGPWGFIREPLVVWRQGTGDSGSLSQAAQRDPVQVNSNLIRIHERILQEMNGANRYIRLRKRIIWRLMLCRMSLMSARLRQMSSLGARSLGALLNWLDHYWDAAFGRPPLLPKMKTRPFDGGHPGNGEPGMVPQEQTHIRAADARRIL